MINDQINLGCILHIIQYLIKIYSYLYALVMLQLLLSYSIWYSYEDMYRVFNMEMVDFFK